MLRSVAQRWIAVPTARVAALANHVLQVFGLSTKKQVVRANARRIIAPMAHIQPFRDGPVGELVADAMGAMRFAVPSNDAIAFCVNGRFPDPTVRAFIDVAPEANLGIDGRTSVGNQRIAVGSPSFVVHPTPFAFTAGLGTAIHRTRRSHVGNGIDSRVSPVDVPALVVHPAPATTVRCVRASINRTGRLIKHRILHWFGVTGPDALTSRPSNYTSVAA